MSRAYDTARSLGDQELLVRANDLARYVIAGEKGLPRFELPPNLSAMYQLPSGSDIFAIRDANGRLIGAAPPRFGEVVAGWPGATFEPVRFSVRLDPEPGDFDGLTISRETVTGLVSVSVGRSSAGAAALYSLMRKFIHDTIWAVSILVLAALVVGILDIRSGLKPVRNNSDMTAAIRLHAMSVLLPDKGLPSEISPLVTTGNNALDRVERGFTIQRQFPADTAPDLRT